MANSQFNEVTVLGRVRQAHPAADADHLVRQGEVEALASGLAPLGHAHELADVTDFREALPGELDEVLTGSSTIEITTPESGVRSVAVKRGWGLTTDEDGLAVNYDQVTSGLPRAADLHAAATVSSSGTIALTLNGQEISAAARLAQGGGLTVVDSGLPSGGLAVDIAAVTSGLPTMSDLHEPVTVVDTESVRLFIDAETQVMSGTLNLTTDAGESKAPLRPSPVGLHIELGGGAKQAAPGNHTHGDATTAVSGFFSNTDKQRLEAIYAGTVLVDTPSIRITVNGATLEPRVKLGAGLTHDAGGVAVKLALNGGLRMYAAPDSGIGVNFGTDPTQVPRGNHRHDNATEDEDGFFSSEDKQRLNQIVESGVGAEVVSSFVKQTPIQVGQYVGGRVRFSQETVLTEVNITGRAPVLPQWFEMEVDGVATGYTVMLSGVPGEEAHGQAELEYVLELISGVRTAYVRWFCASGVQDADEDGAEEITINMGCRPRLFG